MRRRVREAVNNQNRVYYVDLDTGERMWDLPKGDVVVERRARAGAGDSSLLRLAERAYHHVVVSETTGFVLFGACVAGLLGLVLWPS